MRHRVFIAIDLPEDIKKELASYQQKWPDLPAKWIRKDNLHITLEFLGYVPDEGLLKVFEDTRELALKHKPFSISLNKICYGPPGKMPPRMVWAVGGKVKELDLMPHINLCRINAWQFRQIEPEERPQIEENIDLEFEVNSIEVMESVLKRAGPEYTILESCQLKN